MFVGTEQGVGLADGDTFRAEGTFATLEIDGGKAAITADDDGFGAGSQAVIAACAGVNESGFG